MGIIVGDWPAASWGLARTDHYSAELALTPQNKPSPCSMTSRGAQLRSAAILGASIPSGIDRTIHDSKHCPNAGSDVRELASSAHPMARSACALARERAASAVVA